MKPTNDRKQPLSMPGPNPLTSHKRFKIERLEQRVAPTKGGKGTHNCSGSSNTITVSCSGY